jgi:hypothetical protein
MQLCKKIIKKTADIKEWLALTSWSKIHCLKFVKQCPKSVISAENH